MFITPLLSMCLCLCGNILRLVEYVGSEVCVCVLDPSRQQPGEGEKNGSEEEDEGKPGKRMMGPRKKFVWDDKLR